MTAPERYLISYNLNGIRSAVAKGLHTWLQQENPDVLCIQESKAQNDQIDIAFYESLGYHCFLHPAQRKGYSGTGIFSKQQPDEVIYGIGIPRYDAEGRFIRADYGDITLICSYFPSGTMGEERQQFKMDYLADFLKYILQLRLTRPKIIITGDFNISHKPVDINNPKAHEKTSGYLPEERAWLDALEACGFVDTFRVFHKGEAERYSWWSHFARSRARNIGWRLDYFWATGNLQHHFIDADILKDVVHSDHCPVTLRCSFQ
ncbi:MAG: exodeoxyribonuclease III [Prevotellaceae bacterium]|jgi:exodeoxyribonuclease-3|nr:exodeoxyribonuclease III [Prevotellaceae bacterium]